MEEAERKARPYRPAKVTQTAKEALTFVKRAIGDAHQAKARGQKVAWTYMGTYVEPIVQAFDIVAFSPENYGAVCAVKMAAEVFLDKAVAEGYSNWSCCGYFKTCLGLAITERELGKPLPDAPEGGLPCPDMYIGNTSCADCRLTCVQDLGRYWDVPHYVFDFAWPQRGADLQTVKKYYVKYIMEQIRDFIAFLERQTGKRYDEDKVRELTRVQHQVFTAENDIFQLCKAVPCPIGGIEMLSCIAPAQFFSAYPESADFYARLRDEVKYRVENKMAAVPNERYRLLWGFGVPVWHTMEALGRLESEGAVLVMNYTYYNGVPYDVEFDDPLETLAHRIWERFTNLQYLCSLDFQDSGKLMAKWIHEFKLDGIVQNTPTTCQGMSLGLRMYNHEAKSLAGVEDLPVLYLEGDMVDPRLYAPAEQRARVDAFLEQLEQYKSRKQEG